MAAPAAAPFRAAAPRAMRTPVTSRTFAADTLRRTGPTPSPRRPLRGKAYGGSGCGPVSSCRAARDPAAGDQPDFRRRYATQNRTHAVPQTTLARQGLWRLRLRPGFELPRGAAILGGKVNERLGSGRSGRSMTLIHRI